MFEFRSRSGRSLSGGDIIKPQRVEARLNEIREAIIDMVKSNSNYKRQAKQSYINSISPVYIKETEDGRVLGGFHLETGEAAGFNLVQAMEEGMPSFDIKKGALESPKAKVSNKGKRFVDIPITHHKPYSGFSTTLPKSVYAAITLKEDGSVAPSRPSNVISARDSSRRRRSGRHSKPNSRYDRLFGSRTPANAGGKSDTYTTIRRISETTDPSSWIHPGFRPMKLMKVAQEMINRSLGQFNRRDRLGLD